MKKYIVVYVPKDTTKRKIIELAGLWQTYLFECKCSDVNMYNINTMYKDQKIIFEIKIPIIYDLDMLNSCRSPEGVAIYMNKKHFKTYAKENL